MIVFADDLGAPAHDAQKVQTPVEFLRTLQQHKGWYDKKTKEFKQVSNIQFIYTIQSGHPINWRCINHTVLIPTFPFSSKSLEYIFSELLKHAARTLPQAAALMVSHAFTSAFLTIQPVYARRALPRYG
jgi:hypothetical protein